MAHHTKNMLSASGPAMYKQRAIHEAESQQKIIEDKLKRLGLEPSDYEFRELIGKGSFGRVYKSFKKSTKAIVAVKVLETDSMDFAAPGPNMEAGITDAMKEIGILRRLKESGAVNVNMFVDAFQVHSQLWIVSEYCSGGSLSTLRRATENKISEPLIIAIARELALGLRSIHAAGIVHRDIKAANVMIDEQGHLQIIDFGVSGIVLSNLDEHKRKTIIGTPHWMPPEMHQNTLEVAHGMEVDVWSYGITLYECAMGGPPHARTQYSRELRSKIRQTRAPRLPADRFSNDLADLVEFALEPDPNQRPTMDQICEQSFLADSVHSYPTESLKELIEKYYAWEIGGGQRASLFMPFGAAAPKALGDEDDNEEWTFSTTADFEKYEAPIIERRSMRPDFQLGDFTDLGLSNSPPSDDYEPFGQMTATYDGLSGADQKSEKGKSDVGTEDRIAHGGHALQGLFDQSASPYTYNYGPSSDLRLRSNKSGELHQREISVGSTDGSAPNINLDLNSLPKNRKPRPPTMGWKWNDNLGGSTMPEMPSFDFPPQSDPFSLPQRPPLIHSTTEPVGIERPASTLDLDSLMDDDPAVTARNTLDLDALMEEDKMNLARQSTTLKPDDMMGSDLTATVRKSTTLDLNDLMGDDYARQSQLYARPHGQPTYMQSAGSSFASTMLHTYTDDDTEIGYTLRPGHGPSDSAASSALDPSEIGTTAVNSTFDPRSQPHSRQASRGAVPLPMHIPSAALEDSAPPEVMMDALTQQINNWTLTLQAFQGKLLEIEAQEGYQDDSEDDEHEDSISHYASSSKNGSGNWNFGEPGDGDDGGNDDDGYHGEGETTGDDADDGEEQS